MQALSSKHALGNCNVAASRSSRAQRRAFVPTMSVTVAKLTSATCSSSSPVASRSSQRASAGCSLAMQSRAQAVQTAEATTTSQGIAHGVRVAVVGVGLMGNKIARRLASQGAHVSAWNRSADKTASLPEAGISVAGSVAAAATASDVLLLTLSDAATIRETILCDAVRPLLKGKTVLQMGTIGPKESAALAVDILAAGGSYVEAPVLGSQPEAEKGTLLVMVGAEADPREPGSPHHSTVWPLLRALGQESNIHFIGPVGTGAAVKLALNQLIASLTVGFSTSLGLVQRSGADVDKFMSILRASALYAPTYDKKLQKMLDRDYGAANFPTKHLLKDVRLFETEAAAAGLDTRLLAALKGVVQDTVDRGLANTDYSAVFDAVAHPGEQQATKQQQ